MMRLRALYETHAEAIEADFQQYYGIHVGLLGTEALTYRRFKALLFKLPRESWFMQATLGEPARWSTTDYLIAHVIDAVNVLVNIFQTLHRRKNSPKPKWKPFPRPGFDPDKDKLVLGKGGGMSVADLKKRLARRPATME